MKLFIIGLGLLVCNIAYADLEDKPAKFKTTFNITYNEITLQEANNIEAQIRKQHKKACTLKTNLNNTDNYGSLFITAGDANVQ